MNNNPLMTQNTIKDRIFTVRDTQVMLDKDLAELYNVKPTRLREQVKRNTKKFPNDFMFELSESEADNMVSQNAIPSKQHLGGSLPLVFTEQGVSMLATVLKSDVATEVSINIMRTFVSMRKFILENNTLFQKIDVLEQKQLNTDQTINKILEGLEDKTLQKKQGVFFDGQIFDAYVFISELIKKAKKSVVLVDNYIDETTLLHLSSKADKNVKITILTKTITKAIKLDIEKNNTQYTNIKIQSFKDSHDRFLIVDEQVYHLGASIKDLGKKWFAFSLLDNSSLIFMNKIQELLKGENK